MKKTLFGHEVELKNYYCQLYDNPLCEIKDPYVNLYIQLKGCNANCTFCDFQNAASEFNSRAFIKMLSQLSDEIDIRKISITGGEPTLVYNRLKEIVALIKGITPKSFLIVNTNGLHLEDMYKDDFAYNFDSIALSRHHFMDNLNSFILGYDAPRLKMIKEIQSTAKNPDILHLSCNLIKDYVYNESTVLKYLEHASKIKATDVGFVTLMKINKYAEDRFVDYNDIQINSNRFHKIKEWKLDDCCKCNNYLYIPEDISNGPVKVYSRCSIKPSRTSNILVWNGEHLSVGFEGQILI